MTERLLFCDVKCFAMLWLKRYVEAAQPDPAKRVLMTQSLGNMVACEALREGLAVGKYFMFDAAVPSEAIDATLRAEEPSDEPFPKYVPGDWQGYTNASWGGDAWKTGMGDATDREARAHGIIRRGRYIGMSSAEC